MSDTDSAFGDDAHSVESFGDGGYSAHSAAHSYYEDGDAVGVNEVTYSPVCDGYYTVGNELQSSGDPALRGSPPVGGELPSADHDPDEWFEWFDDGDVYYDEWHASATLSDVPPPSASQPSANAAPLVPTPALPHGLPLAPPNCTDPLQHAQDWRAARDPTAPCAGFHDSASHCLVLA